MKDKLFTLPVLGVAMVCGLLLASCHEDELATSPSDQPRLSLDTLNFGQLLASNHSRTYQLHIFNTGSKELRLSSVALRHGGESGFRMNVDGMSGSSFTEPDFLRIASHDSLFVFVEATFPATGQKLQQHTDYIDILCNGKTQTVVLQAESKEVQQLRGAVINTHEVWPHAHEVQIFDSLVIAEGASLTIQDSATLYLHDKANIVVRGTLICQGQPAAPVTFRGDRNDRMFTHLSYDNLPSQWGSLTLAKTSQGNRFEYTDIRGMSQGIRAEEAEATFACCHIKNSGGTLISSVASTLLLDNCELTNAAQALYEVYGGSHTLTHCTLANYHFAAPVTQLAVCIYDGHPDIGSVPLRRCRFTNTLVWGKTFETDVEIRCNDGSASYLFDHCLLRARGTDDDNFIETLWNTDPQYRLIDDAHYTYDFHLQEQSPAIGHGVTTSLKTDLDGVLRSKTPTIGCYEFIKQ